MIRPQNGSKRAFKGAETAFEGPETGLKASESELIRLQVDASDSPTDIARQVARATNPGISDLEIAEGLRELADAIEAEVHAGGEW